MVLFLSVKYVHVQFKFQIPVKDSIYISYKTEKGIYRQKSLEELQRKYGEIDWKDHVRISLVQSKTAYKLRGSSSSSTLGGASSVVPAGSSDHQRSFIDQLFDAIYKGLDEQALEKVREAVQDLQLHLKVTSGRESRTRGGWKYGCDFLLDTVLFSDVIARLQEEEDIMKKAICLTLRMIRSEFMFYFWCCWCCC